MDGGHIRRSLTFAFIALTAFCWLGPADPIFARDRKAGEIEFDVSLEPKDLGPGQSGTLVVKGVLVEESYYIYADPGRDRQELAWTPLEAPGVTYQVARATLSEAEEHDTGYEELRVHSGEVVWRIPVTLDASVKPGTKIGIRVSYQGCTDMTCFQAFKDQVVCTEVPGLRGPRLSTPPLAQGVTIDFEATDGALVVTFTPQFGHHVYGGDIEDGIPVSVTPVQSEGVEWGDFESPGGGEISTPIVVKVPYRRTTAAELRLRIGWQACADGGMCFSPGQAVLVASWSGPAVTEVEEEAPLGDLAFEVIEGDELTYKTESKILSFYQQHGLLVLGLVFGLGVLLAFTPCVLPIIPLTVSVIAGGRADMTRGRLLGLLTVFVGSLALTFGVMGVSTAFAGASMSAAFQEPVVIVGIAVLFALLALGMLGVYELQPPQWMLRLQGGAHSKGGSYLGAAILGGLMAVVASPCTGPFIVGMALVSAKSNSVVLGFAMFSSMGLGMGAVLFAFGALNLALRPGPWMVWVRYLFGMLLFGGALYQVAFPGILSPVGVVLVGGVFSVLSGALVWRHLAKREGETNRQVLRTRALGSGGMLAGAALVVLLLTGRGASLEFEKLRDVAHLKRRIAESADAGKPAVVDVWATTCFYCRKYEELIYDKPDLRADFERVTRLKIDTSEDDHPELRDALGIPRGTQPYFVFIDRQGRIRRAADIKQWHGDESASALKERLQLVLGESRVPPGNGRSR